MTTDQSIRVGQLLQELHRMEHDRREVAASGPAPDPARHNQLANQIRLAIEEMPAADVRSALLRTVVDGVNGDEWPRCPGCNRPTYRGHAARTA